VLVLVDRYPETTETYVKTELEALAAGYDVTVVARNPARRPFARHLPFQTTNDADALREIVADVKPSALHTHYLWNAPRLLPLAEAFGIPFTVRAHSCDTMIECGDECTMHLASAAAAVRSDWCRGVLSFPYTRPALEAAGIPSAKLIDCFPVLDFDRFHDRSDNGDAVLHVGSCQPKKGMEEFLLVAGRLRPLPFNLYAIGPRVDMLRRINVVHGNAAHIADPVDPDEMPALYKRHRWLAYTASTKIRSVGWPIAVAEAQAAGVGVCLPNLRPDLRQFVGDGALLYESRAELEDMLKQPVPDVMREAGFEQARRSDVKGHLSRLTALWH
jgi:glycosyltransferase involved in cell wall biosynthesis